ncbi:MAG: DUF6910 family protein, partial [Myxococcales bacterium]
DALHLGRFTPDDAAKGTALRLLPGALPEDAKRRKAEKPDFEILLALPPFDTCPEGALLALGSGSAPQRRRGVLLPFRGGGCDAPRVCDFSPLFERLETAISELNLEGAALAGDRALLLQRGNGSDGRNAVVELDRAALLEALGSGGPIPASVLRGLRDVPLGALEGVPLGFTDGAGLADGSVLFTAAAEAGGSTWHDGACPGSVVGMLTPSLELAWLRPVDVVTKLEGIARAGDGTLYLVADADDPARPAALYRARL